MSRYIEQNHIGNAVSNLPTTILQAEHGIELVVPVTDAIEIIKDAPSIEIVYCRECKYWSNGDDVYGICFRCPNTRQMKADDFCSYGEREGE